MSHVERIGTNRNGYSACFYVGWGIGVPDVQTSKVDGARRTYTIENLRPNKEYVYCDVLHMPACRRFCTTVCIVHTRYVISLRAYNRVGNGFPIYETVRTLDTSTPEASLPLSTPIGLRAISLSSSAILLTWTDSDLQPPLIEEYQRVTGKK